MIDGLKFDFRIYVLLAGCDPLRYFQNKIIKKIKKRIFIYTEGMARFATERYELPNQSNYSNLCMHLTNYAINKESD